MSLKIINESFKRLYESEMEDLPIQDEFSELEIALRDKVDFLISNNQFHIKQYEIALQDVIENHYPENSWWEITNVNIFMDLFENRDPYGTVDRILRDLRGEDEEIVEESLNEARNYDNLEINDKIAKALSRKSFAKKYEKELNDLGIQIQYPNGQGTILIGPNGKRLSSSRMEIYGPSEPGFNRTHEKGSKGDTWWEDRQVAVCQRNLNELQSLIDTMNLSELARRYPNANAQEAITLVKNDFEDAKSKLEAALIELNKAKRKIERRIKDKRQQRGEGHNIPYIRDTTIRDKVTESPIDYLTYLTKPTSALRNSPDIYALDYGTHTPRINTYNNLKNRIDYAQSSLDSDKRWYGVKSPEEIQAAIDELEADFNRKVQHLLDTQESNKRKIAKSYDSLESAKKAKDDFLKSLGIGI